MEETKKLESDLMYLRKKELDRKYQENVLIGSYAGIFIADMLHQHGAISDNTAINILWAVAKITDGAAKL